jgi:hypothetical protein
MAHGSITGRVAHVQWLSYTAVTLDGFLIARDDETGWALRGTVQSSNAYQLAQSPLVLRVPHAQGAWYWPVVRLEIHNRELSAVLGPPVE